MSQLSFYIGYFGHFKWVYLLFQSFLDRFSPFLTLVSTFLFIVLTSLELCFSFYGSYSSQNVRKFFLKNIYMPYQDLPFGFCLSFMYHLPVNFSISFQVLKSNVEIDSKHRLFQVSLVFSKHIFEIRLWISSLHKTGQSQGFSDPHFPA